MRQTVIISTYTELIYHNKRKYAMKKLIALFTILLMSSFAYANYAQPYDPFNENVFGWSFSSSNCGGYAIPHYSLGSLANALRGGGVGSFMYGGSYGSMMGCQVGPERQAYETE